MDERGKHMTVTVWFGDAWGPYPARAVAEVTESLAEALIGAGVAVEVSLAPPLAVDTPEAALPTKTAKSKRKAR